MLEKFERACSPRAARRARSCERNGMRPPKPLEWHKDDLLVVVDRPRFGLKDPDYRDYIVERCLGLRPGMVVVDVGCGSAASSLTFVPYVLPGGRLVGCDRDPEVLQIAERHAAEQSLSDYVEFRVGEAERIPSEDDEADVIYCQTLLMHVPDAAKVLAEMIRVVKPGGLVAAMEPDFSAAGIALVNGEPRPPERAALWAHTMTLIHKGAIERGAGDWTIGSRVGLIMRELGLKQIRVRQTPGSFTIVPSTKAPSNREALDWAMELFYPPEGSDLFRLQRDNYLAGGGTKEGWQEFADMRALETEHIMGDHEGSRSIVQTHIPGFLSMGRLPE